MAIWHDVRDGDDVLYSVRSCWRYSVWPEYGQWVPYHQPTGSIFDQLQIGNPSDMRTAQAACRDHAIGAVGRGR